MDYLTEKCYKWIIHALPSSYQPKGCKRARSQQGRKHELKLCYIEIIRWSCCSRVILEILDILQPLILTVFVYLKHYLNLNPTTMSLMSCCDLALGNTTWKTNCSFQLQNKSQNKSKKETWGKSGKLFSMVENTSHFYLQTELYSSAILSWVTK